jgi:hypothetical protein
MKRYTSAQVIAETFGIDFSDMKDYRYQAGRSDKPIYSIDDDYYCASKIGNKPAEHFTIDFEWSKQESVFADKIGWQVWKCSI